MGSGFGLYGYLPAICQHYPNSKVLLKKSAKNKAYLRPELKRYLNRITWVDNVKEIIKNVELLIISYPPFAVENVINLVVLSNSVKRVIIEKPVCQNPEKSLEIINILEKNNIKVISSFLFIYTKWFDLIKNFKNNNSLSIDWKIVNVNSIDSWKWNHKLGGGVLSFYGIHIIAIYASLNCKIQKINILNSDNFEAVFANSNFIFNTHISYIENKPSFILNDNLKYLSPFETPSKKTLEDYRVPYLKKLFEDLDTNFTFLNKLLKDTISLWKKVENSN